MKIISTVLVAMLFGHSAFAFCIFGDHLVETARMSDLTVSKERIIRSKSDLRPNEREHFIRHIKNYTHQSSFQEAIDYTDYREFAARTIRDTVHNREYTMYLYLAGDTWAGFFVDNQTKKMVATVSDGSIYKCKAGFDNFDALKWFYVN